MGLEPDPFISKPMDLREKTDKNTVNSFAKKWTELMKLQKTNGFRSNFKGTLCKCS